MDTLDSAIVDSNDAFKVRDRVPGTFRGGPAYLVRSLGVFFGTLLICSITAFIILTTNPELSERRGADLTQSALEDTRGAWSGHALTVIVAMLAFGSLIGNYYYGEADVEFLTTSRPVLPGYRMLVLLAVFGGALGSLTLVWNLADVVHGGDGAGQSCRDHSAVRHRVPAPGRLSAAAAGRERSGICAQLGYSGPVGCRMLAGLADAAVGIGARQTTVSAFDWSASLSLPTSEGFAWRKN